MARAQNAYVQLIHAVADVVGVSWPFVLDSVDIYLSTDGGNSWTLAIPDFKFRQATPYIPIPANSFTVKAAIAPGNSSGPADILPIPPYDIPPLPANSYNVGVVAGTIDFATSQVNVDIYYYNNARNAAQNSNQFDFIVFHGAPQLGTVGVYLAWDRPATASAYQPDFTLQRYGYSSSYTSLSLDNLIVLDTTPANPNDILPIGFYVPNPNPALLGQAGVIFASGYIGSADPRKAFGLHLALSNGSVLSLSNQPQVRRLQLVHNAADPALAQVDIHVGQVGPDPIRLNFRQATPTFFLAGPSGASVPIILTGRGQTAPLATLNVSIPAAGQNHIVFAQGVLTPSSFAANPNGISTAFRLHALNNTKGWAPSGQFIFIPFHGVTDAPAVDVYAGSTPLATDIKYLEADPEVILPAGTAATVEVRPSGQATPVASFSLSSAQSQSGKGTVIFASGFLNPSANQNGPSFGLFIAYPEGDVQPLSFVTGVLSSTGLAGVRLSENPNPYGQWKLSLEAALPGEIPYTLTTLSGEVQRKGSFAIPGPGTWVYELNVPELPAGIYLFQIGGQVLRLVRL
ncbi:MAG: hypothetical protein RMJ57_08610 [Bacteroidia bacterium]|nr:hypothetical protein [Bacteroidia bacterium]